MAKDESNTEEEMIEGEEEEVETEEDDMEARLGVLEESFGDLKEQYKDGEITWEQMLQDLIAAAEAELPQDAPMEAPADELGGLGGGPEQGLSLDQLA